MERYIKAALAVAAFAFLLVFGVAILPLMVALLGGLVGVLAAFAPMLILVVIVVVLANTVFKK